MTAVDMKLKVICRGWTGRKSASLTFSGWLGSAWKRPEPGWCRLCLLMMPVTCCITTVISLFTKPWALLVDMREQEWGQRLTNKRLTTGLPAFAWELRSLRCSKISKSNSTALALQHVQAWLLFSADQRFVWTKWWRRWCARAFLRILHEIRRRRSSLFKIRHLPPGFLPLCRSRYLIWQPWHRPP